MSKPMIARFASLMGRHEDASALGLRLRAWMMRFVPGQLSCTEFENFVCDYQAGELSPRQIRAFDLHMELCPMCQVYFATYLQTIELGRRICVADEQSCAAQLPEDLTAAILAARRAR